MKSVIIDDSGIRIPIEVFISWGQPKCVWYTGYSDQHLVRITKDVNVKYLVKKLFRVESVTRLKCLGIGENEALFENDQIRIPDGSYGVANYEPIYQLMPHSSDLKQQSVGSANKDFWADIESYHEHSPAELQEEESHQASRILVTEIQNLNFSPQRILELGCGAGRNLKHIEKAFPNAEIYGIDVNPAVIVDKESESNIKVLQANILDLDWSKLGEFDVIITCGFLMHINHHEIKALILNIDAHSKWHIHWELHGEIHPWDYHRYPRSYLHLFDECGLSVDNFRLDTESNIYMHGLTPKFCHCLVTSKSRDTLS